MRLKYYKHSIPSFFEQEETEETENAKIGTSLSVPSVSSCSKPCGGMWNSVQRQ